MRTSDRQAGTELVARSRRDPCWFVEHVLGGELWSKQREILESVRDHPRTAVRSCHGPGKTITSARALLWFLFCWAGARVITTAPTAAQVDTLWREVRTEHSQARFELGGRCLTDRLEIAPDWFAMGRSTDDHMRFQGQHADHILLIVDEASGVDSRIFEAGMGYLTSSHARVLLTGNPNEPAGQFYDAFNSQRALWNTIAISVFDTPNFTSERAEISDELSAKLPPPNWVEDMRAMWGEGTIPWQVRVLGQFSDLADNTVIPLGIVEAAQAHVYEPGADDEKVMGVDVAEMGTDETVVALRHGQRVRILDRWIGKEPMHTAGKIVEWWRKVEAPRIVIDDLGVGSGVTSRLREMGLPVQPFRASNTALDVSKYPLRRDEHWFTGGELLGHFDEHGQVVPLIDLDPDPQLLADLVAPQYKMTSRGQRKVESKAETKKRLGRSPDRADAVLLTLVPRGGGGQRVRSRGVKRNWRNSL